ncbi:hypothetical protein BU17DRAFT_38639 [Hysterangium stoloniferum]|nr:hypothetical protein BU17DRAFT_38639 [Hysterangium stoloniferum]
MSTGNSATPSEPPPYSPSPTGFPPGYFLIKNLGTGKLLDIERNEHQDGEYTEAILYPETENSHVLALITMYIDLYLQIFFTDYLGNLCSKASGHGLDVNRMSTPFDTEGKVVIRHRRPVTTPFPNQQSHPLPQFHYSPRTCHITIQFAHDPTYPGFNQASASTWRDKTYFLTSIPLRKPRGLLDDAADFIQGAASVIANPFASVFGADFPGTSSTSAAEVRRGEFDLREDELLEVDRADEDGVDDSPDPVRRVRVISLLDGAGTSAGALARERRRWEVIPLLRVKAMTGAI